MRGHIIVKTKMDARLLVGLMVLAMVAGAYAQVNVDMDVDQVVVYPQSVALVYESGTEGSGTQFKTEISSMAYPDSIRVPGASELSISTANTVRPYYDSYLSGSRQEPMKQLLGQLMGKVVTIGGVKGTLTWMSESWLGISNATAFTAMPISSTWTIVSATPMAKPNETVVESETMTNVTWLSGGNKETMISYLASGFSWNPVYFLDAGESSSRFEFWAKVTNSFEDLDANVKLVGGNVRISGGRYYDTNYYADTMAQEALSGGSYSGYMGSAPSVSTAGEYEVYDLGKKTIKKGESRLISIFANTVTPEKEYVWDTRSGDYVQRIYLVENPGKTWSYGTVKVYENGILMGEDAISWTPKGQKAKITIGNAPDIDVSKKTTTVDMGSYYSYKRKHTTTLTLKNYKAAGVTVKLIDSYPTSIDEGSFESSEEFVKQPGNLLEMNVTLSAGQERVLTYSYTT